MKVKRIIKRWLREALIRIDSLLDYRYDYSRYLKYSIKNGVPTNDEQFRFRLLQRAHSFEKGLSMANIRPLFGKEKLRELLRLIRLYEQSSLPKNSVEFVKAVSAFRSYLQFHEKLNIDIYKEFDFLAEFKLNDQVNEHQSVKNVQREEILRLSKGDFVELTMSRFSSRQFSEKPVALELIKDAVLLAQKTPSVCNRQSSHAFLIEDETTKKEALRIQAGNNGFGHEVKRLLIITSSLESFDGPKERNQSFIDGGLFAMSVINALHYNGLATCPLNWSSGRKKDQRLRQIVDIPKSHNIIMLLAIGHHKDEYRVAASPRRSPEDVFRIIN